MPNEITSVFLQQNIEEKTIFIQNK